MNRSRVARVGIAAALGLAATGAVAQAVAGRLDQRRFPAPGRMIDVGGHCLHMNLAGDAAGGPTVVLEAGMASMSSNWAWVRDELAPDYRVITYDRAGLGWSERGTGAVDAATSADQLHTALTAVGAAAPYVLVGHSYGGLVVRMFADQYPEEVIGLALVDASHPDQWVHIPASRGGRTVAAGNRLTAVLAAFGLLRVFRAERAFISGLPPQEYAEMRAYLAQPEGWLAGARGLLAWATHSRNQVNGTRELRDLPLIVLSVTEQDRYADVLTALQADLVKLSSNSRQLTVAGATHYTLVSDQRYAAIVTDAIRAVADAARSGGPVREPSARQPGKRQSFD
jgi:pimeloyl-ACP methyl ester carboxylesterase